MKTLIAAVDISPDSMNAAYYAADMAASIGAGLLLINVVQIPVTIELPMSGYGVEEMMEDSEQELAKLRDDLVKHTHNKVEIKCESPIGSVPWQVNDAGVKTDAFAVVMGMDSISAVSRLFTGSNTLNTMHMVHFPVLIVPKKASFTGLHTLLLASDLREMDNYKPLQLLKNWIKVFGSKLQVLYVHPTESIQAEVTSGSIALQNELGEFDPEFHFIKDTNIEEAVLRFAEQHKPDLLIVIPKKHGMLSGLFYKSKSKALMLHAHIPVLAIHK